MFICFVTLNFFQSQEGLNLKKIIIKIFVVDISHLSFCWSCFQDGVIVENMHDVPYVQSDSVGPEVTAMMTAICIQVKRLLKPSPVGIQVLAGANKQAMAVAKAAGGWGRCCHQG